MHEQDETYNANQPDVTLPRTDGMPMSSYGFVMDEITEESLIDNFANKIDMIRAYSKLIVDVDDSGFEMEKIYLLNAAQESRIRSTVISYVNGNDGASFSVPVDLGGTITYPALAASRSVSDPIYFYPNAGGDYTFVDDVVNQNVDPQYVIIKGQAVGYDTPGYYKVALKAQYPLNADKTELSDLTYDILRNTSFTIKLLQVDKPGYKTYEEAASDDSPANNISYSIIIESDDSRYEVLVSKGTYYAQLETSRVYVKGYMDKGIDGCYLDFTLTATEGNVVPSVYVQTSDIEGDTYSGSGDNVEVTHCLMQRGATQVDWVNESSSSQWVAPTTNNTGDGLSAKLIYIAGSSDYDDPTKSITGTDATTRVRVYFNVNDSGRIRLRIGDMLKFIPVIYDSAPISMYGTIGQDNYGVSGATDSGVIVADAYGNSWSDFSYDTEEDIEYDNAFVGDDDSRTDATFVLTPEGTVTHTNTKEYTTKPEFRARIFPKNGGDGISVLYLRQASDFKLINSDSGKDIVDDSDPDVPDYNVIFHSQSMVEENNTAGLFADGEDVDKDGKPDNIVFSVADLGTESVDPLTISINTETTTKDEAGKDPGWAEYFEEDISEDKQTLTLSATTIPYDYEGLDLDKYPTNAIIEKVTTTDSR